jgi:NDP-sugar pyrophosphorylase family protein
MSTIQESGSVTLETHPELADKAIQARRRTEPNGWLKTCIHLMDADEAIATVYQQPGPKTHVHFQQGKGGFFGIATTDKLVYIALPGSRLRLPDTHLDMPGGLIEGKADSPIIPTERPAPQQVTDQAMILGAGLASRFVPVSGDITGYSKPGVPLIGEDSVIVALARHLQRHGIRKIFVNTYYKPEMLKDQLSRVEGVEFVYIDEDSPSGTAGGLVKALQQGLVDTGKPVLIVQGDAVTNADFSRLIESHGHHQPMVTLGVKQVPDEQVALMAIVETDGSGEDGQSGYVHSFKEKPTLAEAGPSRLGSIGFYVISPAAFADFRKAGEQRWEQDPEFDYAMHYFPGLLATYRQQNPEKSQPSPIMARLLPEPFYWSDIGRPDQYIATIRDIYTGKLGMTLPENASEFYEHGILYWPGARQISIQEQAQPSGNVIVARRPQER